MYEEHETLVDGEEDGERCEAEQTVDWRSGSQNGSAHQTAEKGILK